MHSVPAAPFPVDDEIRIDADRGIVDEDLAVDVGEIDTARMALGDGRGGCLDLERDVKVLREMVERAERQHAEPHVRAGEGRRRRADGPVAAARDHRVDLPAPRACHGRGERRGETAPLDPLQRDMNIVPRKCRRDAVLDGFSGRHAARA